MCTHVIHGQLSIGEGLVAPHAGFSGCPMEAALHVFYLLGVDSVDPLGVYATLNDT